MSVDIEYCDKCVTKEEILKKSEELKLWYDNQANEKWTPMSYNNPEITLTELPQVDYKNFIMSRCTFKADAAKVFEFLKTSTFEQQKVYDTDLLAFEKSEVFPEDGCEVSRVCYKAPWPVTSREFVSVQNYFEKDGAYYFLQESINYPTKWNEANKNFVRGYKKSGLKMLPKGDHVDVWRIVVLDPRGSIPGWVVSVAKKDDAGRLFAMKTYFEKTFPQ
ncbi:hypothetical protein EIN_229260 [Entamoeba invadens IP1]|uniref:START domain-containing protein n=1 Tax=Entamoeba invadens IP1 TaxID=370355 RepID=A0A0A1U8U3_ENTIV|nr:hypothetical protein EIN_229260 [Entamoeba invadens IP1]ELP88403.1 hypothetical protein EIN_229260 [Entamoeba invadens IP1]|eukprot:XP_004255174.1 hypothetical protein EIN_229260 [Entamoeba invadens IP1]